MPKIIYVLTNPVMPGLVKIGEAENLKAAGQKLSRPSDIPAPFELHYACSVDDSKDVEKALLEGFADHRVKFLRIDPQRIVAILKVVELENVTPGQDYVENPEEQRSLDRKKKRRPRIDLERIGIAPGETLYFTPDLGRTIHKDITAKVIDNRRVEFEGEETSLSESALRAYKEVHEDRNPSAVSGSLYWVYEDEILWDRRDRFEKSEERDSELPPENTD